MRTYQPVGLRALTCQSCGVEFYANRSDAKWCEGCRWTKTHAHNSRPRPERAAPPERIKNCIRCGKDFVAKRNRKSGMCWECRAPSRFDSCPDCGATKSSKATRCKACHAARLPHFTSQQQGENNPSWKGGRIRQSGYVYVLNPDRNDKRRYRPEHVLVWEQANGPVPKGYEVHHLNGVKDDNRLENLTAMTRKDHHTQHEVYERRIRALER